ncbi:hypothetical protein [Wolbachia endosymbiont of Oedothorax gibbosus]|uniref:hypothetical protein n=1 Tax=Wolbachia endosymbiont of Oedothorax gibbosus TaxID=931100 RepID=UPI002025903C|nr:hypothetical protein [Wolbachia endosymbiont of Oedothorax gibbosus]
MLASNNPPLLKDSQKTKGTIWKPLIVVSSLSIFSFISGQYLPYVIIAVSGSGPIAAVPLAIFAVSTAVALISTIYLIRLAVSRADSKKEAGLDGEEFGHIASQELVCGNCANLENKPIGEELIKQDSGSQTEVEDKSNVSTPTPPPVTLGTQPNPSPPPLPPPPPPGFFIAPKRTEQPKNGAPKKAGEPENGNPTLLEQIEGIKLKTIDDGTTQKNTTTEESTPPGRWQATRRF